MEWVTKFHGQTVGLDTAPLVFFIEENPLYNDLLDPFFKDLDDGRFRVVTTTITLLEVLVHPLRYGNEGLARQYNDILLSSPNVTMLPVTHSVAQLAAELRAEHKLKTPDAIQLATALSQHATVFITNDRDFPEMRDIEILKLRNIKF